MCGLSVLVVVMVGVMDHARDGLVELYDDV